MALRIEQYFNHTEGLCGSIFDEDLTIYEVEKLKQEISIALGKHSLFLVDLANVEFVDSAGIQLLLAFKAALMRQEKEFNLGAMSESLKGIHDGLKVVLPTVYRII